MQFCHNLPKRNLNIRRIRYKGKVYWSQSAKEEFKPYEIGNLLYKIFPSQSAKEEFKLFFTEMTGKEIPFKSQSAKEEFKHCC